MNKMPYAKCLPIFTPSVVIFVVSVFTLSVLDVKVDDYDMRSEDLDRCREKRYSWTLIRLNRKSR